MGGRSGREDMVAAPGGKAREARAAGKAAPAGADLPAVRKNSRLTVLSGPSGVGKSTVVAELRRRSPEIWISVSATTRRPRPGEVDGREYYFVTSEEFDRMVSAGELLEWAEFAGNKYGTPAAPVQERLEQGLPTLLEIDLAGARQVRAATKRDDRRHGGLDVGSSSAVEKHDNDARVVGGDLRDHVVLIPRVHLARFDERSVSLTHFDRDTRQRRQFECGGRCKWIAFSH